MHRRQYIGSLVGLTSVSLTGCVGGDNDSDGSDGQGGDESTPEISQVSVSNENHSSGGSVFSITVQYATQTVAAIRDPDSGSREPDAGNKYVVLHGVIQYESEIDQQVDLYVGSATALRSDGVFYGGVSLTDLPSLTRTVSPGATYDGWLAYDVPEETTQATLVGNEVSNWFDYPTEILFEESSSLSANQFEARQ